ncbi:MAG: class I SAM-dependent methyltransferase [Candidatus Omnitrophota bacterium]|nr:MAG: class I SAM-dependent methyltransferase [Candidatus Omnitrophota bacterium]
MKEKYDTSLEMSRYIDLELYHEVEKTHPFYVEMIDEILSQINKFSQNKEGRLKILEFGAGTGILTKELLGIPSLQVDALEIDQECCKSLNKHISSNGCNIIQGDIVTYCKENYYDLIVSSFAHDHISHEKSTKLAENIKRNLKKGGVYIMGGEILPPFSTKEQQREALYKYHGYIINKALKDENFRVAQIEINALKSGLEYIGDFKRHVSMFEEEISSAALKIRFRKKIGPHEVDDVGGVYVYVIEAA